MDKLVAQLIWGNKMIQSKGRTLFYKNWYAKNIIFIDDLLDQNGNLKSVEEIFCLLERSNRNNWLIEYKTILKALPATWKQTLTNVNIQVKVKKELKPFICIDNNCIYDLPDKAKTYYELLIKKVQVGKDQEKTQSEKDSHSKNRGGKKPK